MTDWFEWNGTKCTEYGIHVEEHPAITLPAERATFTNIPGRSGSLTVLEDAYVYDDMLLTCTCFIENTNRLPEIAAWLRGSGTVTFANRQGGFYYARIVNQIPFEQVLRGNPHRSFTVTFRCKPFFYLTPVSDIIVSSSGTIVSNPYSVPSEPKIIVTGTGDISLLVGATSIILADVSSSVTLDTELQECFSGVTLMNSSMTGDFPMLVPGSNGISWVGNVSSVKITPRWRTL